MSAPLGPSRRAETSPRVVWIVDCSAESKKRLAQPGWRGRKRTTPACFLYCIRLQGPSNAPNVLKGDESHSTSSLFEIFETLGDLVHLLYRSSVASSESFYLVLELQDAHDAGEIDSFIRKFLNATEKENVLFRIAARISRRPLGS